jgi:cold shock CspA family protein
MSEEKINLVKVCNGTVKLYNSKSGMFIRQIGDSGTASFAVLMDGEVHVNLKNGKVKIYNAKSGMCIRTISN